MSVIENDQYMEVCITDESGSEFFYWVRTDDEDEAVEMAVEKHIELKRPEPVEDFDSGVFPMAYNPVIPENKSVATILSDL